MFHPFIEYSLMVRLPTDPDSKVIFPDQWHARPAAPSPELPAVQNSVKENNDPTLS
jgi:hypothetical protein